MREQVDTAMILAAGRGNRLRPITDRTPKPLIRVAGDTLIGHHMRRLREIGVRRVVINLHHLGDAIRESVAHSAPDGLKVDFSPEAELLETAGGIHAALPLLGDAPFLVVNGDVYCDHPLQTLLSGPGDALCHLVMVPSPPWHTHGDFDLEAPSGDGRALLRAGAGAALTYAGIGVYSPDLFDGMAPGPMPLRPLFDAGIAAGRITGEVHTGRWDDIGTPQRLEAARAAWGA